MGMEEKKRHAGGRPRKFSEVSRPVTVTLPERTLRILEDVDSDRAKAIVKVTDRMIGGSGRGFPAVEVLEMTRGKALIVVTDCPCLHRIPWMRLIEIAPGRNLLTLEPGTAHETLEVSLMDLEDSDPPLSEKEAAVVRGIRECLASHRRSKRMSRAELIFVDPE